MTSEDTPAGDHAIEIKSQGRVTGDCERCGGPHDHDTETCCSSHGKALCHRCYRRTHFVEICSCGRPACAESVPTCEHCSRPGSPACGWVLCPEHRAAYEARRAEGDAYVAALTAESAWVGSVGS